MKMHWCTCRINLSGQGFTTVVINQFDPISWPEVMVAQALHGEENVMDIKAVGVSDTSPTDEKRRLLGKYGRVTEAVFPGRVFRMQMLMDDTPDNQSLRDSEGRLIVDASAEPPKPEPKPEEPDDDGEDDAAALAATPAVFKPGKHQPPRKEA